ncbi:MAG: hypothetical protein JWM68_4817 [Verrucomicrobiales bacterium]|nr:hypothetical protein [Verrucomicrobiales bacterium]
MMGADAIELVVDTSKPLGKIDLTRFALGQGGLSDKPMFDAHIEQIAQLHPQTIRIFVQEFFELYPAPGKYHWETLDKVIETILATGAKPILSLCFKPKVLFPTIDQHIVHPSDYRQWEELITALVKHCNEEKHYGIEYWEVSNEPDIGEDGGCPYLFDPQDYVVYYQHTAQAILRADPRTKIGGPALAGYNSDIGNALIQHCGTTNIPLDFFSWHIYHSDPNYFRKSVHDVKAKLAKFPRLKNTETIIDEWNMSLDGPVLNPAFQPAFVLEITRAFHEEGLGRSAYYHIRDSFVDEKQFSTFMSKPGAAFVAQWWNDTPQYDGLYDNQGRVRPAYFAFKLLSLVKGQELAVSGTTSNLHSLASIDEKTVNILLWNFADQQEVTQHVLLKFSSSPKGQIRVYRLNSTASLNQLELQPAASGHRPGSPLDLSLEPYGIRWISVTR